jgi:hypothetical protein
MAARWYHDPGARKTGHRVSSSAQNRMDERFLILPVGVARACAGDRRHQSSEIRGPPEESAAAD